MLKGLLLGLVSLCTQLCVAQDSSAGAPPEPEITSVPDSALYLSDLSAAVRDNSKVILNWRMINNNTTDFIAVERSSNNRDFETVAVIKQSPTGVWYEWIDEAPAKGRNVYRVRFAGKQGAMQFSKTIPAIIAGDISFRFYPNPVDNILIIRSEFLLDVQVIDGNGKVRLTQNKVQGLQTLNVSSLEKGLYLLRINNLTTGLVSQERLLKN
ncbi:T9SS type A sorting domain-containing protein [Paraflavitalea sp. CAU 1676]|uniref:T9SS type A sorting domain-containing protein n=1 Tax=Paraflavitalea sp. CAU 1676 TaxID=3032598 RepID=UPI0023DBAEDE|nr:T9SS type A sorting domain-containing protein [Paraflavitalea sp. CAU 1676]MDF2191081.1 T9SS type A sorting domain-containing protein [Paraflavitalea sp. CAU 1676]